MTFDLNGQVAVVTGGAKGIGFGIASRLAKAGATVAIWDFNPALLQNVNHPFVMVEKVDVTDWNSVKQGLSNTIDMLGKVDILINNAGVNGPTVPTWDYPLDAWNKVLATDLTGVFLCCRAVAPIMKKNGYGRIVSVASVAGKEGNAHACAYSAAKAGVIALTKSLGKELAQDDVIVNCVAPAMVETDLLQEMTPEYIAGVKAKIPMGRFGTIEEIADMVTWLSSEECSFSTGSAFDVSGGRATY
ncbi:MAG: SDR family NAD(P)-dependent oxidoreductase [Chloroflexota bacterium]